MTMDLSYALRGYDLSNTARVIYGLLDGLSQASARNGKPYTYISRASIAERVGVCEKTVRTCLKSLKSVGLITEKRMGRGLNNHIFVFLPKEPQEEKQKKVEMADHSIYQAQVQSRTVKNSSLYTNGEKFINNSIDYQSIPTNDKDCAPTAQKRDGITAKKNRPTNKRPSSNLAERNKRKAKYKEYLYKRLEVKELKESWWWRNENIDSNIDSIEKVIELIANIATGNGKIMVNGALLTSQAWWYGVKNITQERVFETLNRVYNAFNVKNRKAYLLASLYNDGIEETITQPCQYIIT